MICVMLAVLTRLIYTTAPWISVILRNKSNARFHCSKQMLCKRCKPWLMLIWGSKIKYNNIIPIY